MDCVIVRAPSAGGIAVALICAKRLGGAEETVPRFMKKGGALAHPLAAVYSSFRDASLFYSLLILFDKCIAKYLRPLITLPAIVIILVELSRPSAAQPHNRRKQTLIVRPLF